MVLLATICFAAMEGGPKAMRTDRATSVVGGTISVHCNGNSTTDLLCPTYKGVPCGYKEREYRYSVVTEEKDGVLEKFFNKTAARNCDNTAFSSGCVLKYKLYDASLINDKKCTPKAVGGTH
jgi:hypothetical protein